MEGRKEDEELSRGNGAVADAFLAALSFTSLLRRKICNNAFLVRGEEELVVGRANKGGAI